MQPHVEKTRRKAGWPGSALSRPASHSLILAPCLLSVPLFPLVSPPPPLTSRRRLQAILKPCFVYTSHSSPVLTTPAPSVFDPPPFPSVSPTYAVSYPSFTPPPLGLSPFPSPLDAVVQDCVYLNRVS